MKFFKRMKDGGAQSTVTGYWLIEAKSLFSICILKFEDKSREAFHNHAFNCISWVLKGKLTETMLDGSIYEHKPSLIPFKTTRQDFHKVDSDNTSLVFTIRGPWLSRWKEYIPESDEFITLAHGRELI